MSYLVITPLGMSRRDWLAAELERRAIAVGQRRTLAPWPPIATAFRLARKSEPDLERAAAFEQVWRALCPDGAGEAWSLDRDAHHRLAAIKRALRLSLPSVPVVVGGKPTELHAIHLADLAEADLEARAIDAALARSTARRSRARSPSDPGSAR